MPVQFYVAMILTDGSTEVRFDGTDATRAYNLYTSAFRELLTTAGNESIITRIDGEDVSHFDCLLEDCYL